MVHVQAMTSASLIYKHVRTCTIQYNGQLLTYTYVGLPLLVTTHSSEASGHVHVCREVLNTSAPVKHTSWEVVDRL